MFKSKFGLTRLMGAATLFGLFSALAANAVTVNVDGGQTYELGPDATLDANAYVGSSDFNQQFANSPDTTTYNGQTYSFGTIRIGDLTVNGDGRVVFYYDINEPGGGRDIGITDFAILVDNTEVWSFSDDDFFFNTPGAVQTASPLGLGGGADAALNVSFDLFKDKGFTGNSTLTFLWKQVNDSAGGDQWVNIGQFVDQIGDGPIVSNPVPLPAGLPLLLAGLGGLAVLRRRSRT